MNFSVGIDSVFISEEDGRIAIEICVVVLEMDISCGLSCVNQSWNIFHGFGKNQFDSLIMGLTDSQRIREHKNGAQKKRRYIYVKDLFQLISNNCLFSIRPNRDNGNRNVQFLL